MLEEINKLCVNCKAEIDKKAKICPKCGVEQPLILEKVSNWWYVFSIFLGLIGGVIAWAVNKDRNPKKAVRFIVISLVFPLIYGIGILSSTVLVSLGSSKVKAKDAGVMASMNQIRVLAEMEFDIKGTYVGVNCANPQLISICNAIKNYVGVEPIFHSSQNSYCVYSKLSSKNYSCVDNQSSVRQKSINPGGIGYCDGSTFICPIQ